MKLVSTFAKRFEEALKIRNMKQTDIVNLTGIGKSSICTYLTGEYEPKQKNTYKIAKALNVSETWLMGYDVPMEKENSNDPLKDVRMASYNGVDVEGLSDKEIEEIKQFVEFVRNKNKK